MAEMVVEVWRPNQRDLTYGLENIERVGEGKFAHVVDVFESNNGAGAAQLYRVVLFNDTSDTGEVRQEVRSNRNMWIQRWREYWEKSQVSKTRPTCVEALAAIVAVSESNMKAEHKLHVIKLLCKEQADV